MLENTDVGMIMMDIPGPLFALTIDALGVQCVTFGGTCGYCGGTYMSNINTPEEYGVPSIPVKHALYVVHLKEIDDICIFTSDIEANLHHIE